MLTIHRSKGLEFPVVYCPDLWEPSAGRPTAPSPSPSTTPTPATCAGSTSGCRARSTSRHQRQALLEQRGEDLRLAYVALTRARHQAVVWWAGSRYEPATPRSAGCCSRATPTAASRPRGARAPSDARRRRALRGAGGRGARLRSRSSAPRRTSAAALGRRSRAARRARRRRAGAASSTAAGGARPTRDITAGGARGAGGQRAGGAGGRGRAGRAGAAQPRPGARRRAAPAHRCSAAMPGGRDVGTFVHRVFEATDFAAPDLDAELAARVAEVRPARLEIGDPATWCAGLRAALETPLARTGCACATSSARTGSTSSSFELPLAGGDGPAGELDAAGDRRAAARAPARGRPAARLRRAAERPRAAARRARLPDRQHRPRVPRRTSAFAIVDYKTNRLAPPDEPLTAWHYRPEALSGGDGARALRAAGAALHRRAAPLPALAAARLRPHAAPRRRALPVPARDDRRIDTAGHAASSPGIRPRRWSRPSARRCR